MSEEIFNDILHMMEERDMFHCCDYYDKRGFEDDLQTILFKADKYEEKLRALIKDLVKLQGECYIPMYDKDEIACDLEEIIEEYKVE